jgi:predicted component of type VI protein secretion system
VLAVIEGEPDDKFLVFALRPGDNLVGRDRHAAQVRLVERSVSHVHARIACQEGAYVIEALQQQRNPTYLNDREITVSPLADGDTIRMGRVSLRFRKV